MIDDLRALAIFAKVAEAGSFSAAGRALRLSTSVVSHHVKALEDRNGVTLFYRSTRALSLTEEGRRLLDAAQRMVAAAEQGLDAIADISAEPAGALRVTAPAFSMNSPVEAAIWDFTRRYPGVSISLHSTDAQVNLVADGYDMAIRLGAMSDSGLKSRKIGIFQLILVGSPAYLSGIPVLKSPQDLARCDFVQIDFLPEQFQMTRKDETINMRPERSRVVVNSVAAARSAVLYGLGIRPLPLSEIQDDLVSGRLVRILPDWNLPTLNTYAVWPAGGRRTSLVSRLLQHLVDAPTEVVGARSS